MSLLRRSLGPVVLIYNLIAFGMIFLLLSNGQRVDDVDDVVFLASQDAALAITMALVGIALNIAHAYLKWRDGARARHQRMRRETPRITGE